jgi:hypothetical protein
MVAIKEELATIDREMLERVYADFQQRLENCIQDSGHHLPDYQFKWHVISKIFL